MSSYEKRESGIEALKILGILLIIMSHVVQTLYSPNSLVDFSDYVIPLNIASTDLRIIILNLISYSGQFGNWLFFISSAWFLLDSKKVKVKKVFTMVVDVWIISIVILIVSVIIRHGNIEAKLIIKSCFPVTTASNWYITSYLLFYCVHPLLNMIIDNTSKATLFRISSVMIVLYAGINFIHNGALFYSVLLLWIAVYFSVAYMKHYLLDLADNIRITICVFIIGFAILTALTVIINALGLKISYFNDKVDYWRMTQNPLLIIMGVSLFNLARMVHFKNKVINYISSLSLLMYVIHENVIVRNYLRPYIWNYIYNRFGYNLIFLWIAAYTVFLFAISLVLSIVYKEFLKKPVNTISNKVFLLLEKTYIRIESVFLLDIKNRRE